MCTLSLRPCLPGPPLRHVSGNTLWPIHSLPLSSFAAGPSSIDRDWCFAQRKCVHRGFCGLPSLCGGCLISLCREVVVRTGHLTCSRGTDILRVCRCVSRNSSDLTASSNYSRDRAPCRVLCLAIKAYLSPISMN